MTATAIQSFAPSPGPAGRPANDNRRRALSFGRSLFPDDALAVIFRPSRSVMTSGRARARKWKLAFARRTKPFIEPLMGYTGSRDSLVQVELEFPTLESAVAYAERQGLAYVVRPGWKGRAQPAAAAPPQAGGKRAFSDAVLGRLGLGALRESYGRAMAEAANRNEAGGEATAHADPMAVVADPSLPLDEKRSILMNWAWHEYLIDQATAEGMPENGRPSRLHEVELALLALERGAAEAASKLGMAA